MVTLVWVYRQVADLVVLVSGTGRPNVLRRLEPRTGVRVLRDSSGLSNPGSASSSPSEGLFGTRGRPR